MIVIRETMMMGILIMADKDTGSDIVYITITLIAIKVMLTILRMIKILVMITITVMIVIMVTIPDND